MTMKQEPAAMTVQQLRDALASMPPDAEVVGYYDAGHAKDAVYRVELLPDGEVALWM